MHRTVRYIAEDRSNGLKRYVTQDNSIVMQREYDTKTPNGNDVGGRWVLRDGQGNFLDFDQYRSDLAERNSLYFV